MLDKIMQTMIEKLHTERYIVDLSEDIEEIIDENNAEEDYNYAIDDEEWGNDF